MTTIEEIYNQVTVGMKYDLAFASNQQKKLAKVRAKARCMPLLMSVLLKDEKRGSCLNFSLAMMHLLHRAGIETYLAALPEENPTTGERTQMHASVCYVQNGDRFFADPVGTVKEGKKERFRIPIQDFKEEMLLPGEAIFIFDVYGKMGEQEFFGEFTKHPKEKFYKEK